MLVALSPQASGNVISRRSKGRALSRVWEVGGALWTADAQCHIRARWHFQCSAVGPSGVHGTLTVPGKCLTWDLLAYHLSSIYM